MWRVEVLTSYLLSAGQPWNWDAPLYCPHAHTDLDLFLFKAAIIQSVHHNLYIYIYMILVRICVKRAYSAHVVLSSSVVRFWVRDQHNLTHSQLIRILNAPNPMPYGIFTRTKSLNFLNAEWLLRAIYCAVCRKRIRACCCAFLTQKPNK